MFRRYTFRHTKLKKNYNRKNGVFKFREILNNTKYSIIYEAYENDKFYIGKTDRGEVRFDEHTSDPKSAVYQNMDKPTI